MSEKELAIYIEQQAMKLRQDIVFGKITLSDRGVDTLETISNLLEELLEGNKHEISDIV